MLGCHFGSQRLMALAFSCTFVVAFLAQPSEAILDQLLAELATYAWFGTVLSRNIWFALAVTFTLWYGGAVLFIHSNGPQYEQQWMHREHPTAIWIGGLLALFYNWLFCWPRLIEAEIHHKVQFDHTPRECCAQVEDAERRQRGAGYRAKANDAWRTVLTGTITYIWTFVFMFGAVLAGIGGYLVARGDSRVNMWPSSTTLPLGITLLVFAVIFLIVGGWKLYYTTPPNECNYLAGRWTLKYLFVLIVSSLPPAFYDYVHLTPWARGLAMVGIYIVLGILFYFYARYLGLDPYFSDDYFVAQPCMVARRHKDAVWYTVGLYGTPALLYMSMALSNEFSGGSKSNKVANALLSQLIAAVLLIIFYLVVYWRLYRGYACGQLGCPRVAGKSA